MRIVSLHRYGVKSFAGMSVDELGVGPGGAAGDRRWAVVNRSGERVSAREVPELLHMQATPYDDGVRLAGAGGRLDVPTPYDGPRVSVGISRLPVAIDAGDAAATFLTAALRQDVRLVWQADPITRSVNPANGGLAGEVLNLADAGPLLLTTETSLARLQGWVGPEPVLSMARFRPNVVVDGDSAFAEDDWREVRIGDLDLRVQHACDRCVMTMIDPVTLSKGKEPIRALSQHRKWDGKVWFGVWLVPKGASKIRIGDALVARS